MWWTFLLQYRKQGLIVGAAAAVFGAGYWYGVDSVEVTVANEKKIEEKISEDQDIKENRVKDTEVVTTIEEKPDGSKVTKIVEKSQEKSDIDTKSKKSSDRKTEEKPKVFEPNIPTRYKLGLFVASTPDDIKQGEDGEYQYGFSTSLRLFGPVWLDGSYKFESETRPSELSLGASWEF